jgi:hypothetical protein
VTDPRKLRPSELCRLLNSTPLGEVINQGQLRRHRTKAGLRIGDARYVNLVRYISWLVQARHAPKPAPDTIPPVVETLAEAAQGAAALGSRWKQVKGHGQKLTSKQESVIAALLTEPTYAAAAKKAGIGETTLYRWLKLPDFRAAFDEARRELVKSALRRLQAGTIQAVETLFEVSRHGRRDGDRVRAALGVLDHALNGLADFHLLYTEQQAEETAPMNTTEVVQMLASRLRQLDAAQLPTTEKARLTGMLSDAYLRAFSVDDLNKRMEALEAVLRSRKENER